MDTPNIEPAKGSTPLFAGASPKLTFIFGAVCGVAGTALIVIVLFLVGGFSSAKTKTGTVANTAVTNNAPSFTDVKAVSSSDYIRGGDENSKITLIEYSDYECPYCQTFLSEIKSVVEGYDGKVAWVYRQFPLSFHKNAQKESEAGLCIGKLGGNEKFWSFTDKVFARTGSSQDGTGFALADLGPLAKEVGVNQAKFQACLDSNEMAAEVAAQEADGTQGGASGTPTTFVVDTATHKTITAIPGAYTAAQMKSIIDQALAQI